MKKQHIDTNTGVVLRNVRMSVNMSSRPFRFDICGVACQSRLKRAPRGTVIKRWMIMKTISLLGRGDLPNENFDTQPIIRIGSEERIRT